MEGRVHHRPRARVERDLLLVGDEAAQLDASLQTLGARRVAQSVFLRPSSREHGADPRFRQGQGLEQQARPLVRLQPADPEDVVREGPGTQAPGQRRRVIQRLAFEAVVAAQPVRHRPRVREDPLHLSEVGGVPPLHGVADGDVLGDLRREGRVLRKVEVVVERPVLMEDPGHLAVGAHVEGRELEGDHEVGARLAEVEHPPLIGLAQDLVLVAPSEGDAHRLDLVPERRRARPRARPRGRWPRRRARTGPAWSRPRPSFWWRAHYSARAGCQAPGPVLGPRPGLA